MKRGLIIAVSLIIVGIITFVVISKNSPVVNDGFDRVKESLEEETTHEVETGGEETIKKKDEVPSPFQGIDITSDDSTTVLVNKFNSLSETYEPEDLVFVEVPTVLENKEVNHLRQIAADSLYDMFGAAKEAGFELYARSGYRSHSTQVQLFNSYVEVHGEKEANQFSARPGYSEHQTGLVMDITSETVNYDLSEQFGETDEGKWVQNNAHKFGFIIRYPKGKEEVTGYVYEPWHLRYLGVELATLLYESELTFEEFLEKEGIIDNVKAAAESEEKTE